MPLTSPCRCKTACVRKSCQRKSSIPTRFNAARHAFVLTWRTGLPRKLNTRVECLPICSRFTITAAALSGTAIALRAGLVRMNPCRASRQVRLGP